MGLFDNVDWDETFSYQTVKYVTIRERKLGIIHYILQGLIFIYIVVFTILYQQRYLLLEPPYGSIRATVQQSINGYKPLSALPYCWQTQGTYKGFKNQNCTYLQGTDLTYPPGQINSVFISTRIKDTYYKYNSAQLPNSTDGTPIVTLPSSPPPTAPVTNPRYYLADIEDYTLYMEHAIFRRMNELLVSNVDCDGKMEFRNGSSKLTIPFTNRTRGGDIVSLQTIINAANVGSLDEASGRGSSWRYDGLFLVAVVDYKNYVTRPKEFYYNYQFYVMPNQDVVNMQPSQPLSDGYTVQRNWYGVRIIFMVVGSIGMFDLPTLLTSLMNGMVLIKVSTVIVDLMLLYIMPAKKTYARQKFEPTSEEETQIRIYGGKG